MRVEMESAAEWAVMAWLLIPSGSSCKYKLILFSIANRYLLYSVKIKSRNIVPILGLLRTLSANEAQICGEGTERVRRWYDTRVLATATVCPRIVNSFLRFRQAS